ncbi:Pof6 interactor protein 1 [Podosphaera aphanis]|nr:Pof6 interactor protein 1 [Podosphaera aphanis]
MSNPELDIKKLLSLPLEQQDIYLLGFISNLSKHIYSLSPDDCTVQQTYLKKELLQILNLTSHPPSRVIRNNLGRCFAHILGKGDRKLLFETINDLNAILKNWKTKSEGELRLKHAAVHCLGEIFAAAGDSAIGLYPLVCASLLKALKNAQGSTGLRAAALKALGKIFGKIGINIDESMARDIWKQARNYAIMDKAALVQIAACWSLGQFSKYTAYFESSTEFQHLKSTVLKVIDSPSSFVRQAAAECLAEVLVKSYLETPANENELHKIKKLKHSSKKSKGTPDDEDEFQKIESSGSKKNQKLTFTLPEMLNQLSTFYVKSSTSNRSRAGIAICYTRIFKILGERKVEAVYMKIVDHFTVELLGHVNISCNRYRLLNARRFVQIILENVIGKSILGDAGQINAATNLINNVLKNYPQVIKERPEPEKHALVAVLSVLASLIKCLGSASNNFADSCQESLLQVLQHPSYTVQVHASYCLRAFTLACPQQLLPCLRTCMNNLDRELNIIGAGRNPSRRCVGYSIGLSALISTVPLQPLYGSVNVASGILSLATNLLKSSSKSELRASSAQIQVAWTLIGGLMSLGPNFVKIHLPQLLLLWKNALPKPLAKDNTSQRSYLESCFLAHVRECALSSILSFLQFNSRLLTLDVTKRIAAMLQNTTSFLRSLPTKKFCDDISQCLTPSLQLLDLDLMTQRRVLQCYMKLVNLSPGGKETLLQSNLLTLAVSFFADPEDYIPSSLSTSIASSAGNFETIWDVSDNCCFGLTGLVRGFEIKSLDGQYENEKPDNWIDGGGPDADISNVLVSPICSSLEHDSLSLYLEDLEKPENVPNPPATEVVNIAIQIFAIVFPLTPPKIQESILEQITTFISAGMLQRDPGRKAAMNINIVTALFYTLKVAVKETQLPSGDITNNAVERLMQDLLRRFVIYPDQYVRHIGYESLARMCKSSGSLFTNGEIKNLVEIIVSNREPSARAGCAKALGSIHSQVGNMAAGIHLKTIISILMSLCNDPHPTVHFWALHSLSEVAESAGYNFSGYVLSSLGILGQLYAADTHNEEISSAITSNLEIELSTTAIIARCVDSLVNVLGPDLQEMTKPRELILTLVGQFQHEENPLVLGVSLRCLEHLCLYAPGHMVLVDYVGLLQKDLKSPHPQLRDIAVDGLHNLMKRNSEDVVKLTETGFEDQLWFALDSAPHHESIKNVIRNWLEQSCLTETSRWLERCQKVFTMTRPKATEISTSLTKVTALPDLQDEEVAGFALASGASKDDTTTLVSGQEPLRWQVRVFAMSCLSEIFILVSKATTTMHDEISPATIALQKKIAEVIRMAFSASTSNVVELRIWGLKIINHVLKMFGKTPDPDFAEAPLLEQYQAQISAALTPAFAADSSPELASEAVNVCAVFIATGIATDVERMGRSLKTLVSALENFSTEEEVHVIGELKGLSSNAQVMVKLAVFSAWAELQVASIEQQYLVDVLKPHISQLTPLWLESLREFARLRFEPDISICSGPPSLSGSLDSIYSALNRETLLRFYQESWLKLVDAIASLIEQDCEFVFNALDGIEADAPSTAVHSKGNDINYRDEPVAFFFVLFGIAFEALATRHGNDALATKEQTLDILQALRKILHPSVSGHAIYREAIFSETMELLDRLVLTEGLDIQKVVVQIARGLCISHPSATKPELAEDGDLSEDIEQLFELTRIIVLVLASLLPNLIEPKQPYRYQLTAEAVDLICISLGALVDAAEVFPSIIKTDLHACIIHIFSTILGSTSCQTLVVPRSLSIFKRFVESISKIPENGIRNSENNILQIRGCLERFLSIYSNAQKRETEVSPLCVKNSLLACTVLLTSGKNPLPANEPSIIRFLDEVIECLGDRMTAKVAAGCIRTLLLQKPKTPADQMISRYLLPRLVSFGINKEIEDPENARSLVMRSLTAFVATFEGPSKAVAMSLVLSALLARAFTEGQAIYEETSVRLLDLAAMDQTAFRNIVGSMAAGQKMFMESVIVAGRQAATQSQKNSMEGKEPTIALKIDFGG